MIDNGARQFAAIDPDWNAGAVSLSVVLRTILERGGNINVITRLHEWNRPFIDQLRRFEKEYPVRLVLLAEEDFHDKGLVGDDYELAGSMNFTRKGIETNSEHLIFRTDPRIVAERHLELNARWRSRLDAAARS